MDGAPQRCAVSDGDLLQWPGGQNIEARRKGAVVLKGVIVDT